MIVMDRENVMARGWSHVLSTTNDLAELDRFRADVVDPAGGMQGRQHCPAEAHIRDRRLPLRLLGGRAGCARRWDGEQRGVVVGRIHIHDDMGIVYRDIQ